MSIATFILPKSLQDIQNDNINVALYYTAHVKCSYFSLLGQSPREF